MMAVGATYVRLLLAGNYSPLPITLPSAVSELFSGKNVWSALQNTCCALSRGFVCIIYVWGPITTHFTNIHTYIHLPDFDSMHTAWSLASLLTRQLSMTATSDQRSSLKGSSQNACMYALRCISTGTISVSEEWAWSAWMGVACRFIIVSPIRSPTHCDC